MRALGLILAVGACAIPDSSFSPTIDAEVPADVSANGDFIVNVPSVAITEGEAGTFKVSLAAAPTAVVRVEVASTNPAAIPVSPSSIDFTPTNFSTPVAVSMSPPIDTNDVVESATISLSAAGLKTATVSAATIDPTVIATAGWPASPPFTSIATIGGGSLVAFQVTIPQTTNLDKFAVYIPAGTGFYRMALYTNVNAAPNALVAQIAARTAIVNGANVFQLNPVVPIDTGTSNLFWLVVRTSADTAIAKSPMVSGMSCVRNTDITNIDDPWPTTFGASSCSSSLLMNLWITTYHQ